tara:strand:+ start:4922 stop:6016 length:1095 start_codon:yes stop_codon:yes gene_type:complete
MNKLTKLLFSVFTSVAIATSAFAGEFTVSGSAKATYTVLSNTGTTGSHAIGKGLGISNEFSLTASGELDNGMTWSYAQDIDGATVQDDAAITLGTDYGTVKICISECGLSTKYAFDNSAYGIGSDNGYGHGSTSSGASANTMQYGSNISAYSNVQYHTPADFLPFGTTVKVGLTPGRAGGTANDSSHATVGANNNGEMTQYAVTTSPIDGLTISGSYYDFGNMGNTDSRQRKEGGSLSANYSIGSVSIGYGETMFAPAQAAGVGNSAAVVVDHYENKGYSIGFAVNDNLSISFTEEESTKKQKAKATATDAITRSDKTMEIQTIDVAYTVGGATFSVSTSEGTNDSYTTGDDTNEHIFAMSLAF